MNNPKPNYKFKKEDFGVIKSFLKLFKKYGLKRNGDVYTIDNYLVKIINDELVFRKNIDSQSQLITRDELILLSTVIQISSFDIGYYFDNVMVTNKKQIILSVLCLLEMNFQNELKWIVRKNKINKLIK